MGLNKPMKVAIIVRGGPVPIYYDMLNKKLNSLIETSQCFLFYILCGYVKDRKNIEKSLGEIWAERNGAPILYISEKTTERLIRRLFSEADYVIFILNGDPLTNKMFMEYKMLGKHGSVIKP